MGAEHSLLRSLYSAPEEHLFRSEMTYLRRKRVMGKEVAKTALRRFTVFGGMTLYKFWFFSF